MNNKKKIWDTIWQVIEFILTLGISHIAKRKNNNNDKNNKI